MKAFVFFALFVSFSAQAHVEPGLYKGTKVDKTECSFIAGATYFEGGTRHPLNERIQITVGSDVFVVGHPPVIDTEDSYVFFNHDVFQGVLPTTTGAKVIEVAMEHSDRFEGPTAFTFIENNWKTKERVSYKCSDVRLVK